MILQSLNRYYEILLEDPEADISPPGFSRARADFALILSEEGDLLGLTPLIVEVQRGKRTVEQSRRLIVPEQILRSGRKIAANFLWDNATYVLGVSDRDEENPEYAAERHAEFKVHNLNLLRRADCPSAQAVIRFLEGHVPSDFKDTHLYQEHKDDLLNANLVFKIVGKEGFVHEDPLIHQIWSAYQKQSSEAPVAQCLVTGEETEIELTHTKIKGIPGGQPAGTAIVSFNERAYESFGRKNQQGLNAPVGKEAMFGYTTALNYLLGNANQKMVLDDTTVVFWAESPEKAYLNLFAAALNPAGNAPGSKKSRRDAWSEALLGSISRKIRTGQPIDESGLFANLDIETRFCVLGLSPNAARASIRFFYNDPFIRAISNLTAHHEDMALINEYGEERLYPIWRIINETVSKKAREGKPAPLLAGAVFRSVLMNLPYPAALYNAILIRIRADQDDRENRIEKINHLRAAIIKGYLTRKYRHRKKYQEELQMGLNKESTNQAYLLGRLFAVLEKAQQDAAEKELNATVKDRYFTSACATPATTFPILLRLSQHHISKAKYGYVSDRRIQDIMQKLEVENAPFPRHLSLDEQGIFVLGYYHQRADFYKPKTDPNDVQTEED